MRLFFTLFYLIIICFSIYGEEKNNTAYLDNYIGLSFYPGISDLSTSEKNRIKNENNFDNMEKYRHYESFNIDLFYKTILNTSNYLDYNCGYTFAVPDYKKYNSSNNNFPNIKIYSFGIFHTFVLHEGDTYDSTSFWDNSPMKLCSSFGLKHGPIIGNIYYGKYSHSVLGYRLGFTLMRFLKYKEESFFSHSGLIDIGLYYDYFHDFKLSSKMSYSQISIVFASSGF
jgi:hypothetical protein